MGKGRRWNGIMAFNKYFLEMTIIIITGNKIPLIIRELIAKLFILRLYFIFGYFGSRFTF